jgi:hypothetical protein
VAHHDHVVGNLAHHAQVMADEQHAHAVLVLQPGQQLHDLALDGHVQRRGRLVGDQQLGLAGQRHGDHHALLLAARQLVRIGLQAALRLGDADLVEQAFGPWPAPGGGSGPWRTSVSTICSPTVKTGFSELIGSWNTQAMSLPRSACSSRQRGLQQVAALEQDLACRSALLGSRFRMDIAVTLLPEPDSPTRATVLFSGTSKLTPVV